VLVVKATTALITTLLIIALLGAVVLVVVDRPSLPYLLPWLGLVTVLRVRVGRDLTS
jgi:hypothetical protein